MVFGAQLNRSGTYSVLHVEQFTAALLHVEKTKSSLLYMRN
jgi:hypothetical protein